MSVDITDDQVSDLLHEAEERLAPGSRAVSVANATSSKNEYSSEPQRIAPRERLSVREPHGSKASVSKDTAGSDWFDLPKTELTAEMKRDWQILRMRNVLDPKQQKKALRANPPNYSQVGEIIAGPTDFYSSRLSRKERKRNLLQEALSDRDDAKLRSKYSGIQQNKMSGKKGFYKRVVSQRRKNKG